YSLPADEGFVLVLEGRLAVQVDETQFELATGDALTFDPRDPHTVWNPSKEHPARVLFVVTPPPY
ncbi:MAG: cupin domain-containing protein, partial [Acidimicrobiales bacterium]